MWRRILALTIKEFLALLKDRRSRFVLIGPPLIQLLVFGYAATFNLTHVPYAIYNEDPGFAARDLAAGFRGSPNFSQVAQIGRMQEIATLIDGKQALLVIHIGPRFTADLLSGRGAQIQAITDGRNSNTAMLVLNYVAEVVKHFNDSWVTEHGGTLPPAYIEARAWFNPNLESRWFFLPGIVALLTLLTTLMVTALSVAREREQGTLDQLLVTPLRPLEILVGKAVPGFLVGIVEATVVTLATVLWFKVPLLGSLATLYAGIALFMLSAVGVGLMISSLAATQQQALMATFFFMAPAMILSGFATPIANMPAIVQTITLLNPMRYFLVVLRGVFLEGATFTILVPQLWPMAVIGVAAFVISVGLFRRRIY